MSFWTSKLTIKNLTIPRFMSAPMDGVIDSPMRQMIRKFSKEELLFTEMRPAASVIKGNNKADFIFDNGEHPLCFQFSANRTNFIEEAVEDILQKNIVMMNLNAACPAKNIVKSGGGSSLMANPKLFDEIFSAFIKAIDGRVPFTLKMRAGFKEKNALEVAQRAQDLGVEAIIIHPRTQPEKFSGKPDVQLVKELRDKITVPIIYSGNITNFEDAQRVHEQTGVDGFMIGRALCGAPWKLHEIDEMIRAQEFNMSLPKILQCALDHYNLSIAHYGLRGMHVFKKHFALYVNGMKNATHIREQFFAIRTAEECEVALKKLLQDHVE